MSSADSSRDIVNDAMRDSNVSFLEINAENLWIYEKLEPAIKYMNKAYKYDLQSFHEPIQVANYPAGGKFDSHIDIGPGGASTRKLSMSIQLSEPDSYEGGNLEFMNTEQAPERGLGSLIVFYSIVSRLCSKVTGTHLLLGFMARHLASGAFLRRKCTD